MIGCDRTMARARVNIRYYYDNNMNTPLVIKDQLSWTGSWASLHYVCFFFPFQNCNLFEIGSLTHPWVHTLDRKWIPRMALKYRLSFRGSKDDDWWKRAKHTYSMNTSIAISMYIIIFNESQSYSWYVDLWQIVIRSIPMLDLPYGRCTVPFVRQRRGFPFPEAVPRRFAKWLFPSQMLGGRCWWGWMLIA